MQLPKIEEGKFFLVRAELTTGIILNNDNSYYQNGGDNFYQIFDSISDAKLCAVNSIKQNIESLIYDNNGIFIEVVR